VSRIRGRAARPGRLGPLCSWRRNVVHSRGPPSSARRSAPHVARQDASDLPARAGRAACGPPGTAPSSTERPLRGREGIGRRLREIDSLGLIAVCVSEVHSRCPRSSPTLSYRHGARLGVIDRAPIPVSAGTPGAGRDRRGARLTTRSYESVVEADIEALAQRRVPYARQGGARSRARRSRSRARASGRRCARGHRSRDRRAVGRRLGSRAAARRS